MKTKFSESFWLKPVDFARLSGLPYAGFFRTLNQKGLSTFMISLKFVAIQCKVRFGK